ncbi:MAG: translation initiation factor [Schleiferiaceae bacterium]
MSKRGDFSSGPAADNPFASALASALQSKGLEVPEPTGDSAPEAEALPDPQGVLEIRFERRNGKPTTVVFTDAVEHADPVAMASELKKRCSVGGGLDGTAIVLQGDVRAKVADWAQVKGLKVKRVGG